MNRIARHIRDTLTIALLVLTPAPILAGETMEIDKTYAHVVREKIFSEVKRQGEIEAGGVDPKTGELLILFNRGSRIVLGMVKGFYPGYDREISEVYRFRMTPYADKPTKAKAKK